MLIGCTDVVVEMKTDDMIRDCQIIYEGYGDPDYFFEFKIEDHIWENYDPPSPPPAAPRIPVLEVPTLLSEKHQLSLSNTVVLFGEGKLCTKVFALDPHNCQLYFVLAKKRRLIRRFGCHSGYAALWDRLYFLGSGDYQDRGFVDEVIDWDNTDHIDVEAYNLDTKEWDKENTTKLNLPKPAPLVFVYHGKIYALEGPIRDPMLEEHASFECLDPATSAWTRLQSPPFAPRGCCTGILHAQKGTFFLKHQDWQSTLLFAFDLTSAQWTSISSHNHKLYPLAQLLLLRIPIYSIKGACIVENILFTYETGELGEPEIVYYDLDDISPEGEKIDLSHMFDDGYRRVSEMSSVGYLNYLGEGTFSLVIDALAGAALAVCCCTFELKKVPTTKQNPGVSKKPRLQKFNFNFCPTLIRCRAYQMPQDAELVSCQKIQ